MEKLIKELITLPVAIIICVIIMAISSIIVSVILSPADDRYKPMNRGNRHCIYDTKTGLIYPDGTGRKPLTEN